MGKIHANIAAVGLAAFVASTAAYWAGVYAGKSLGHRENQRQNLQVCDSVYSALAENSNDSVNKEFADDRVFAIKMARELPQGNPMREVYLARSEQIRQDAQAALYLQQTAATLAGDTCRTSLEKLANR